MRTENAEKDNPVLPARSSAARVSAAEHRHRVTDDLKEHTDAETASSSFVRHSLSAGDLRGPVHAQMVTGSGMEDFDKTFGTSAQGWTVQQIGCSLGANVLWPGDEVTFTFYLKSEQPIRGPLKVDVIQYGTKGRPGDWWKPVVYKIAETSSTSTNVDVSADGGLVTVRPEIGDAFGGYCAHLRFGSARAGLCLHVCPGAHARTGPCLVTDVCNGSRLAPRYVAGGLQCL